MTLIIAAKNKDEIWTCFDTCVFRYKKTRAGPVPVYSHEMKLRPLPSEDAFLGICGHVEDGFDSEFEFIYCKVNGTDNLVNRIESVVSEERQFTINNYCTWTYLFGAFQEGKPRLFKTNHYYPGPWLEEGSCLGLGAGLYEPVRELFFQGYRRDMSGAELKAHLESVMSLSKRINSAERKKNPKNWRLTGFGLGRLTRKGYELLEYKK